MKHLKIFFTGLVALTLYNSAWAEQIYETTNAEGNPVFTDSPKLEDAEEIELQPTNIADAPQPQEQEEQQQMAQPQEGVPQQVQVQENSPVIVDDNPYNELEQGELRRQREIEAVDPQAPDEVGDSMSQMPDEVGDFNNAPAEVEDLDGGEPQYIEGAPEAERREVRRNAQ